MSECNDTIIDAQSFEDKAVFDLLSSGKTNGVCPEVFDEMDFTRLLAEHKQLLSSLSPKSAVEIPDELNAAIRLHVKHVYEKYNNNLSKTAEALKAARNTVRKYLEV